VLDADGRRQLGDDAGEETGPAGLLQAAGAAQLVGDGDLVERLTPLPERETRLIDPAVLLSVEVLRSEFAMDFEDGVLIHHDGGEDRLFGFDIKGR
jgi:hypothetical protein